MSLAKVWSEKMDDFKIIECTAEKIIVSREPRNETEKSIMRSASQDAILRKWLNLMYYVVVSNSSNIKRR